jgi:peptidoglycan hydrolase-like protein with peptidoglycan-binding domain
MRGVDCATRITPDAAAMLKAQGIKAVGRYLGYHTKRWSKTLTPDEVRAIHSAGLSIFSIWESNPTHTEYFSYSRGVSDAQIACTEAKFIGQPKGTAIYFTVDFDTTEIKPILDYFRGVHSAMHPDYRIGAYGPYRVLVALAESAAPPDFYYQTYAWSSGRLFHQANLYQYQNDVHLHGLDVDKDALFTRIGAWPEVDVERPTSHPTLQQGMCGQDVQDLQVDLLYLGYSIVGAADGIFGPHTLLGVKSFQRDHRLADDGVVGEATWRAIDRAIEARRTEGKPGPAPKPPKPVPRPPLHASHPPRQREAEVPVAVSTDQPDQSASASSSPTVALTSPAIWFDALKNLSQTKNIVSLTLTLLGALKIILEAFGLHVISDQQINDIANGAAAVCTVAGVLLSHNKSRNDKNKSSANAS